MYTFEFSKFENQYIRAFSCIERGWHTHEHGSDLILTMEMVQMLLQQFLVDMVTLLLVAALPQLVGQDLLQDMLDYMSCLTVMEETMVVELVLDFLADELL